MKAERTCILLLILIVAVVAGGCAPEGTPTPEVQAPTAVPQASAVPVTPTEPVPSGQGDELEVVLRTQEEGSVDVYLVNTQNGTERHLLTLDDAYMEHYHGHEYRNGALYIIRRIGYDGGDDQEWSDELWRYDTQGQGTQVFSAKGLDFRAAPDGGPVAIAYTASGMGDPTTGRLVFVDGQGGLIQEFGVDQLGGPFHIGMSAWAEDGNTYWGTLNAGPVPQVFHQVDVTSWQVSVHDVSALGLAAEYALNPNVGQLAYSDYPVMFDVDSVTQFQESQQPVTLFVYDFAGRTIQTVATAVAMPFNPTWVDGTTIECDGPDGESRVTYTVDGQGEAPGGVYRPLSGEECAGLAEAMSAALGRPAETAEADFEDVVAQKTGTGCQSTVTGTGQDFENLGVIAEGATQVLISRGWEEDVSYAGGGAGGMIFGFRKDQALCLLGVEGGPAEEGLCTGDEPFVVCWERLTPEQRLFTTVLNCAQAAGSSGVAGGDVQAERIQFAPGATSAQVQGNLGAGEIDRYVLSAGAGQEMTANLMAGAGAVSAVLAIWGQDGTVLISDHADATTWTGVLPAAQDYYVDLKSVAQEGVDYTLAVTILPAGEGEGASRPLVVPAEFEAQLPALVSTGVPVLLPPEFPGGEGLPPVYPYLYTVEAGEYELSLDYGADCQGGGACHYGSLAGKAVDSGEPIDTRSVPFEADRAQAVTLANGIQGYFVEGLCGASCDDSRVFWIDGGFQYVVGIKAAAVEDVVGLANAAISNAGE